MSRPMDDKSRWRKRLRILPIIAAFLTVLLHASPAAADVDQVAGRATGVSVTGDLGVLPPTPTVNLVADEFSPPAASGPFGGAAPSVNLVSPLPFDVFSTGPLSVATSAGRLAGEDDTGFVEARAFVQTIALGPGIATAATISSSCTADGTSATGTTLIQGGTLNGVPFPPTPNPAPNTVIPVPGIGTITLNEQMVTSTVDLDGRMTRRIVVNAVHARFDGGAGGILPTNQTADAIIAQVICQAAQAPVPPPTTTTLPTPTPTTVPTVPAPVLPITGSEGALPLGVVALGLGGLLRRALRPQPSSSRRGGE